MDETIPQIKPAQIPRINQDNIKSDGESVDEKPRESILVPNLMNNTPRKIPSGLNPKRKRTILTVVAVLVLIIIINAGLGINLYLKGKRLQGGVIRLKDAAKSQDLNIIKKEISSFDDDFTTFSKAYKLITWTKIIPFFGGFVRDGEHAIKAGSHSLELAKIVIGITEPYADLIGLKGGIENQSGEKTTADRIDFIVKTIPQLTPKFDEIIQKVSLIKKEIDYINPARYPVRVGKKEIRSNLEAGIALFDQGAQLVVSGKPILESAPKLLGMEETQTYLVLFQNDKELRPTGGFITAYSIMNVSKAKFEPVDSSDIYSLDAKYKPSIPAPQPIIDYLKGPYILSKKLYLRDMNWSPDFAESMAMFSEEIKKVGINDIDGIIAVDTQLLVYLLDVIGPIGVPGFGNFSTEITSKCNCPQVIYELESFADVEGPVVWDPAGTGKIIYAPPNSDNRKKIIGPLMNSIMTNALGQPKEKLPELFEAVFKSLMEKHVLFYLFDEKSQKAVSDFGIAGRINQDEGDFFSVVDANLGGRKSNLYVTEEVEQEIKIAKDGSVEKTVTIRYKNPEKHDGWLNSVLPNWVRIYVPKNSQLISLDGVEKKAELYEELGKTVFAGYFALRPQGVANVVVTYRLPFKISKEYNLYLQKQPGKDKPLYLIRIGQKEDEILLDTDKKLKYKI